MEVADERDTGGQHVAAPARRSPWPGRVGWLAALVVAGGAGFWAGGVALRPAPTVIEVPKQAVEATVGHQQVGRTLTLNTTVRQPRLSVAQNALPGVVTKVAASGQFKSGDTLYAVAGVPVRVVAGETPFYRQLTEGTTGADVAQLRGALRSLGLLSDQGGSSFDAPTTSAVKAWQTRLGMPATGKVALGELVAVSKLPASLVVDSAVAIKGGVLSGGEKVVTAPAGTPVFVMVLNEEQARLIPTGAGVTVVHEAHQWPATVASSKVTETGQTELTLTAPDGGVVCGNECELLPAGEQTFLLSKVQVVKPVSGPAVPVAAVVTKPDGSTVVTKIDPTGATTEVPVQVQGSQDGVAIVTGVQPGDKVQALAATGNVPAPASNPGGGSSSAVRTGTARASMAPSPEPSR